MRVCVLKCSRQQHQKLLALTISRKDYSALAGQAVEALVAQLPLLVKGQRLEVVAVGRKVEATDGFALALLKRFWKRFGIFYSCGFLISKKGCIPGPRLLGLVCALS